MNSSAFNVTWTGSYAPDGYEIQNYTIYVINATSGELPHEVLFTKTFLASQNTESYSFVYTVDESHLPLPECSWFIFSVTAANSIGESIPTNVSWQLPLGKCIMLLHINSLVLSCTISCSNVFPFLRRFWGLFSLYYISFTKHCL